jgi:hypothetical protein
MARVLADLDWKRWRICSCATDPLLYLIRIEEAVWRYPVAGGGGVGQHEDLPDPVTGGQVFSRLVL